MTRAGPLSRQITALDRPNSPHIVGEAVNRVPEYESVVVVAAADGTATAATAVQVGRVR